MGAVDFQTSTIRAMSMGEAYREAVREAEYENGHDPYNGTISTTTGCKDVTIMFNKSGKSLREFVEANIDNIGKWNCWGICLKEPDHTFKQKVVVENEVQKGTRKWETFYVVYEMFGEQREVGRKLTKTDALNLAKQYVERHGQNCLIRVEKHTTPSSIVAVVKPASVKKEVRGEYVFFGLAGC